MPTLLVAVAGALGAVARYRLGVAVGVRTFPWATLGINVVGCFALAALLTGPASERWGTTATTALGVGFLGAFTTFSTFGYEAVTLVRDDRLAAAGAYVGLSLAGGVAAAGLGVVVGRAIG